MQTWTSIRKLSKSNEPVADRSKLFSCLGRRVGRGVEELRLVLVRGDSARVSGGSETTPHDVI